ncbi:MAG: hypothetical protein ACF8Q5_11060 [Phycisphaerales bacterium JB040]
MSSRPRLVPRLITLGILSVVCAGLSWAMFETPEGTLLRSILALIASTMGVIVLPLALLLSIAEIVSPIRDTPDDPGRTPAGTGHLPIPPRDGAPGRSRAA